MMIVVMFANDIYIKTSGITSNDKGTVVRVVDLQSGRLIVFDETEIVNPIEAEVNLKI